MRIPQVTDRMKEAPTQALRAFFSGIGQLLLAAEKARSRDGELGGTRPADDDRAAQNSMAGAAADPYSARWRSLDKTGNVRILAPDELDADEPSDSRSSDAELTVRTDEQAPGPPAAAAEPAPQAAVPSAAAPSAMAPPAAAPQVIPPAAAGSATAAARADLPVPNYDGLSLPSVRARLRLLDRAQLATLLRYEQAHAGRADFLTMFERRIAKLDAGQA